MNTKDHGPRSLMEAVKHFADLKICNDYMRGLKWPDGKITCAKCGSLNTYELSTRPVIKCRDCKKQFSFKVGTIFEDSPLGLDKWFVAVWCITNAKNGISSCELARAIKVTQATAWFMLHRVRHTMHVSGFDKFTGEVESDETFIGGLAKNMHKSRRAEAINGTGGKGKAIVHGLLERGGKTSSKVKAMVVGNTRRATLDPIIRSAVEPGSNVYTDALKSYARLSPDYIHGVIDHAKEYVNGRIHTNGMENFWSLLKRAIKGTYVAVDAPHLGRYVDEEVFRFNERETDDAGRFATVMPSVVGKRLMYKTLIGNNSAESLSSNDVADNGEIPN